MDKLRAETTAGPVEGVSQGGVRRWLGVPYARAAASDWPAYTVETRQVRIFNLEDRILANPDPERVAAWAGRDVGPGLAPKAA